MFRRNWLPRFFFFCFFFFIIISFFGVFSFGPFLNFCSSYHARWKYSRASLSYFLGLFWDTWFWHHSWESVTKSFCTSSKMLLSTIYSATVLTNCIFLIYCLISNSNFNPISRMLSFFGLASTSYVGESKKGTNCWHLDFMSSAFHSWVTLPSGVLLRRRNKFRTWAPNFVTRACT